jgi:polyhydroxyalkanoate synthesis regulator phasin
MSEKLFTKAFQLGLGAMDLTREKANKLLKELNIDHNTKEGRKLVDNLIKDGKAASKKLEQKIEKHAKRVSSQFVTRKDLDRLEKKLDALLKKKK